MTHRACATQSRIGIVLGMQPMDHTDLSATYKRRSRSDRRRNIWRSIYYGHFNPRRRTPPRRLNEFGLHSLDWYSSHLFAVAVGIALLSVVDAFLTMILLQGGADEVNPIMALVIYHSVTAFAALKMLMTSLSIILMVFLARYRFLRLFRVEWALYGSLLAYISLISYEVGLLKSF